MISIRRVSNRHPALKALHKQTFAGDPHPPYSLGWWWVAFDGRTPVAFAGMQPSARWMDCAYMARCGVVESHRGQGLQKRFVRVRAAFARGLCKRWLITTTYKNVISSNSLISCGFRLYEPSDPWAAKGTLYWRLKLKQGTA